MCFLLILAQHFTISNFRYDPHATQFIRFSQISDFIASLDPPLGISKPNTVALVSFNLPIAKGNKIHCLDILHSLVKHVLGHVEETDNFRQVSFKYVKRKIIIYFISYKSKWTSSSRNNFQLEKNWKLYRQLVFGNGKIKQPD